MSSLPQAGAASETEPLPRPPGGARHFEQGSKAGPLLMQAYYRPSMTSKDSVLFDIIWYLTDILRLLFDIIWYLTDILRLPFTLLTLLQPVTPWDA